HIGHRQAGWPGLIVAGSSFILPAMLIVMSFAWAYVRYGSLPQVAGLLYGVKPVIIAIVLHALWSLSRTAIKSKFLAVVGIVAVILTVLRIHELLVLFGAGLAAVLVRTIVRRSKDLKSIAPALMMLFQAGSAGAAAFGLWPLFLFFLKVG